MIDLVETSSLETIAKLPIWNSEEKLLKVAIAGESNMNLVLRIQTTERSVILKQSKAFVRKFPQIPAPIERIQVEFDYYRLMESDAVLATFSPKVLQFDPINYVLLTEDLGKGSDFTGLYSKPFQLSGNTISQLANYLNALHGLSVKEFPSNLAMKKLNHEHIFNFPFLVENGFDLDSIQPGLQKLSLKYKTDSNLKSVIHQLGKSYLATGKTLIHGDFYPASWLKVGEEIKVIDPEFGFLGEAEFDLGVLFAHFKLSNQNDSTKSDFLKSYQRPFERSKINQFEAIEVMRRLIGIAQLPVQFSVAEKEILLDQARSQLLEA